ncbi:Manganese transporter SMF1 [Candida tropicalis]
MSNSSITSKEEISKSLSKEAKCPTASTRTVSSTSFSSSNHDIIDPPYESKFAEMRHKSKVVLKRFGSFIGPGLLVSVAYMDPGNYATCITAGASNKYSLLFIVFLFNLIAIFLQTLCIKLGSVTGYDLARSCREFLPKYLNWALWVLAECAIIATDVAEVIGSAIALNILLKIPLPAGVVITIVDVIFVLIAYRADTSSLKLVKIFEYSIGVLVMIVVVCFAVELGEIHANAREVFRGFVPSKEMFHGNGMTIATSIIGSTVMIHSLFVGSGLVQPRIRAYDVKHGYVNLDEVHAEYEQSVHDEVTLADSVSDDEKKKKSSTKVSTYEKEADFFANKYKPSYPAIKYNMKYSIAELLLTLFTLAIFVNAAILIVAGATLYGTEEAIDADLYTIHDLLQKLVAPAVGTVFMIALLASGQSAGIVCTIAGQFVSEGHINWKLKPWLRRLVTRGISIIPCLFISVFIGRNGLGVALNISQIIISILLPPLTAPLIYFTASKKIMRVELQDDEIVDGMEIDETTGKKYKYMVNHWIVTLVALVIWVFVSMLNIYAIYEMAKDGVTG